MSLAHKLSIIMGEVGGLKKEGRNETQKYNFVTADAVMTVLRERFSEHGIAFFTSMTDVWQDTIEKTKTYDGKTTTQVYTHTRARFEFTFIDSEDGTTYSCIWFGESDDYGDKGVNKCATAAVKYFLLKMFLIHTADQPDADADKPIQRQGQKRAANAPQDSRQGGTQQNGTNPPKNAKSQGREDWESESWHKGLITELCEQFRDTYTPAQITGILGIERFSDWTQGAQAAFKTVQQHKQGKA